MYDGTPAPEGPAPEMPDPESIPPQPILSRLLPPEFLEPSSGIAPGPFPRPVPAYTREVARALATDQFLRTGGRIFYGVVRALRILEGFPGVEIDQQEGIHEEEEEEEEIEGHDDGLTPSRPLFRLRVMLVPAFGIGFTLTVRHSLTRRIW